jgi:hypothetical protein
VYSIMDDTPKAAQKSRKYRPPGAVGPHGRVILRVTPDKVNTPRLLGR